MNRELKERFKTQREINKQIEQLFEDQQKINKMIVDLLDKIVKKSGEP